MVKKVNINTLTWEYIEYQKYVKRIWYEDNALVESIVSYYNIK